MIDAYVLDLDEVDETRIAVVGGKAAHLGALSRLDGIDVPPGFCVTTYAHRRALAEAPSGGDLPMPGDVAGAIVAALRRRPEDMAYAVRSSATAEDSPAASFAGQHDTYLDVVGPSAVLEHVRRCWVSLFSERAVAYRRRNGLDGATVQMAVVVQQMVRPQAAGVLFTADPITGDRRVSSIDAVAGLGEALVSGHANPDTYKVREGAIVERAGAGEPVLTDADALRLAQVGRRIEARFGRPQDIEWCLAGGRLAIVQSRPITTLFPIPAADDGQPHVYVSVGHQQMMTDPMKALGLSVFQLTAAPVMHEAGGRLFVDVAERLASPAARTALMAMIGRSDPLIADALATVVERGDLIATAPGDAPAGPPPPAGAAPIATDPAIVAELVAAGEASIAACREAIAARTGAELLDFIRADIQELKRVLFDPRSTQVIMAGMEAAWWLNDQLEAWLGEKNASDVLTQSVPGNVTSEMGLALLDVADAVRAHPEVVAFLADLEDDDVLDALPASPGGAQARDAIRAYLDRYGMRCVGEIDITRPRWSERPAMLVPAILANVRNFAPGEAARRFERGRSEAQDKERALLARLRELPAGEDKAAETKAMIDRVRTFAGYREYPKYGIVCRYFIYKQALLREAQRLVGAGVLRDAEDIFHLRFEELAEVARTGRLDDALVARRKEEFKHHHSLMPPRVLTSYGEAVSGAYRRDDVPAGALVGLAVSAGTVDGRARVVLDMADADVGPGDILVTPFTDPSWSPLFVAVAGLVTEVGGLMTHGAVIAREYGLPAVVGVPDATRLIADGRRIRVHGTEGYVELLP